jgi:tetratricopeptide (TPR) repeat protein
MCEGRFDPAMAEIEKARQIDPSSLIINVTKGRFLYYMRQFDVALAHDLRLIELEPKASVTHWATAKIYEQKGMYAQAVEEIVTAGHFDGLRLTPEEIVSIKEAFKTGGWPGFTRMRNQILQQRIKEGYVSPFSLAISDLEVGDKDRAFAWLEKAIDARASGVSALKVDPNLDNLRADARFVKLLAKMNLTP